MRNILLFVSFTIVTRAFGASFDCTVAKLPVEKLICADKTISSLDDEMSSLFEISITRATDEGAKLKAQQRVWLAKRNKCVNVDCLRQSYEAQIRELSCSDAFIGSSLGAASCFGLRLEAAESKLKPLEVRYAKKIISEADNPEYVEEVITKEQAKWREYRNANCSLFGQTEGGTDGWKNAWSAACQVEETEKRLTSLKEKLDEKR